MADMTAVAGINEMSIEAVVIRCQCADGGWQHAGQVCPGGVATNLGMVSYWHKNPLRRWLFAAKKMWR